MRFAFVAPVGNLQTIHPDANGCSVSNDRLGEPVLIVGVNDPCVLTSEDRSRAGVLGGFAVAVLELVLDLAFVTVYKITGDATKEDTRIQAVGVGANVSAENKIAE